MGKKEIKITNGKDEVLAVVPVHTLEVTWNDLIEMNNRNNKRKIGYDSLLTQVLYDERKNVFLLKYRNSIEQDKTNDAH